MSVSIPSNSEVNAFESAGDHVPLGGSAIRSGVDSTSGRLGNAHKVLVEMPQRPTSDLNGKLPLHSSSQHGKDVPEGWTVVSRGRNRQKHGRARGGVANPGRGGLTIGSARNAPSREAVRIDEDRFLGRGDSSSARGSFAHPGRQGSVAAVAEMKLVNLHTSSDAGILALAFLPGHNMVVNSSVGGDFKVWVRSSDIQQKDDKRRGWRCQSVGSYKLMQRNLISVPLVILGHETPYQIVLTKTNIVFPIDVTRRAMQIQEKLKANKSIVNPVMMVSSQSGAGIRSLRYVLA